MKIFLLVFQCVPYNGGKRSLSEEHAFNNTKGCLSERKKIRSETGFGGLPFSMWTGFLKFMWPKTISYDFVPVISVQVVPNRSCR